MKGGCGEFFQGLGTRCSHFNAVAFLVPQPGIQRIVE